MARHVRSLSRLAVIIDLGDVFDSLVNVSVRVKDCRKADSNARKFAWHLYRHVGAEGRNQRMLFTLVDCLLKLDVDLNPELVIYRISADSRRDMEVLKLYMAERRRRTEKPS